MSFSRRSLFAAALMLGSVIPGAAADISRRPKSTPELWARTELYFGTAKPNGEQVTDTEFNEFLANEVTERFPDGLTLLTGYGQFRSSTGALVREKSFVLILLYPPLTPDANKRLQQIREAYKYRFSQESVLRVDSLSLVSF